MTGLSKLILNMEQQLRRAEEKCEEAEARAKELEKQVKLGSTNKISWCVLYFDKDIAARAGGDFVVPYGGYMAGVEASE